MRGAAGRTAGRGAARRAVALGAAVVAATLWAVPAVAQPPAASSAPLAPQTSSARLVPRTAPAPEPEGCAGVSVAVDFGALDAPGLRGCAPLEADATISGLDALLAAGVRIEGTAQWGTSFICRVDDRPGAGEDVPLPDGQTVRESCARTPSQQAYWSLWHTSDTDWHYASTGASGLDLRIGDAVALVFTTGSQAATEPAVTPAQIRSGEVPSGWVDRVVDGQPQVPEGTGAGETPETTVPDGLPPSGDAGDAGADADTGAGPGIVPIAALALVLVGVVAAAVVARRRR